MKNQDIKKVFLLLFLTFIFHVFSFAGGFRGPFPPLGRADWIFPLIIATVIALICAGILVWMIKMIGKNSYNKDGKNDENIEHLFGFFFIGLVIIAFFIVIKSCSQR